MEKIDGVDVVYEVDYDKITFLTDDSLPLSN